MKMSELIEKKQERGEKLDMIKKAKKIFLFSKAYDLYVEIPEKSARGLAVEKAKKEPTWKMDGSSLQIG